jgi:hypothetical protein
MTQPMDVVNAIPAVYLDMTYDDIGVDYAPTHSYFSWDSGITASTNYWLYP